MLSMSDKYDSVNECTQEISESIKLHILWVCENAHENEVVYELLKTDINSTTICSLPDLLADGTR